ncbi:MAG: DUF885 family protein, partial [Bermanella sp.]
MTHSLFSRFGTMLLCMSLTACQLATKPQVQPLIVEIQYSPQEQQLNEQAARKLIAQYNLWELDSSPMLQSYRGLKTNYDQWDDISEQEQTKQQKQNNVFLQDAQEIQLKAINNDLALSVELLIYQLAQNKEHYVFRHHNYPVNQLFGLHSEIPNFLVNIHQIENISDARNYISRINNIPTLITQ